MSGGSILDINPSKLGLLAAILFCIWLTFVSKLGNHYALNDDNLKNNIKSEYKGIVLEKGIDKANHSSPYIVKKNFGKYFEDELIWQYVEIGDSLVKNKGTSKLKIYKKDTLIIVDYKNVFFHYDSLYRIGK